jgi:deoxyribonuclease V
LDKIEKIKFQRQLCEQVVIPENREKSYFPENGDIIFSMDIQYKNDIGYVAIDILTYPNTPIGIYTQQVAVIDEYEPGLFSFREGPLLLTAIKAITKNKGIKPNLLIIDGHGIAHPRKFGVASYLGVLTDLPSIGIAKKTLLKYDGTLDEKRGSRLLVLLEEEIVGKVLRTQNATNPIFVSSGHRIHLDIACELALELAPNYKNIEPIRRADQYARLFAKGEIEAGFLEY